MSFEGSTDSQTDCTVCETSGAELCCIACERSLYHKKCWEKLPLHKAGKKPVHHPVTIKDLEHLHYIDEPNTLSCIKDETFQADNENCLVEYNDESRKLQFGARAFPMLRFEHHKGHPQYPSFVSFIGPTMSGKSFLLRALIMQGRDAPAIFPSPIPAPGAKQHNYTSTSSNIHLYADPATAGSDSPILFLDCEGLRGSNKPSAVSKAGSTAKATELRREFMDNVYPRLVYAFSTCVIFVTSGPLAQSTDIGRQLHLYTSMGAEGSENQGFKPSLFVIFNRFRDDIPGFDWSIEFSTQAFLAHDDLRKLELFYDTIHVVYIPCTRTGKAGIALKQINAFQERLQKTYEAAFQRRQEFHLVFTPNRLVHFLWRALEIFSTDRKSIFNWSAEATSREGVESSEFAAPFEDLWHQCFRYYISQHTYNTYGSRQKLYTQVRETFEKHVTSCLRLRLVRHPPHGVRVGVIPPYFDALVKCIDEILQRHSLCSASSHPDTNPIECTQTQLRHGSYHQGFTKAPNVALYRWLGHFEQPTGRMFQTFEAAFEATLTRDRTDDVSLHTLYTLPKDIKSITSCFGCLQGPPNTFLSCGHAFCLECIQGLTPNGKKSHQLVSIQCPFHKTEEQFSPRLLPVLSGYRILSLDGGGVKGLAQLIILKHIESRCFDIPTTQLFDLIVGTSIGGQIALALSVSQPAPLTVAEATVKFRELITSAFKLKTFSWPFLSWLMDRTKYSVTELETQLQKLFGKELFYIATSSPMQSPPNVAVTTVLQETFEAILVTNYNRKPMVESYTLLSDLNPNECMPTWAAARCTSAAYPYFKGFQWQGQMLLDGGFQLNCPAASAYSEARCIWPGKSCDILLSLGTGKPAIHKKAPPHNGIKILQKIIDAVTNSDDIWAQFCKSMPQDLGVRLNPVYNETGFELDDTKKLDEIEMQAQAWIEKSGSITSICDRLIAALFFFSPVEPSKHLSAGEILCRLPTSLPARRNLIRAMQEEVDFDLFIVEFIHEGRHQKKINVEGSLDIVHFNSGAELRIQVELQDLPYVEGLKMNIKMRGLSTDKGCAAERWNLISGCPYVRNGDGNWSSENWAGQI